MRKTSTGIIYLIISILFSCQQRHEIKQSDLMKDKTTKTDTVVKMGNSKIELMVNLNGG